MSTSACESCGEQNPTGTQFCLRCNSFLAWEDRTEAPRPAPAPPPAEELIETRVRPRLDPTGPPPTTGPLPPTAPVAATEWRPGAQSRQPSAVPPMTAVEPVAAVQPVLRLEPPTHPVVVPVDGSVTELALTVRNLSDIVDGYAVDVGGAPPWLVVASDQLRLLPDTEDRVRVRFRIAGDILAPAGESRLRLRVRSLTRPPAHEVVEVTVAVPVVDAPVALRVEPSVARTTDVDTARLTVVVDNAAGNRPATVRLTGSDAELAVGFFFDPAEITVGPGDSARVRLVTTAPRPEAGREITRSLTVSATEGRRRVDAVAVLVQSTSAVVEDPVVELTATPSRVRLQDDDSTVVRLTVDNRAGRRWATVRLDAVDPERLVHAGWSATEVRVAPGGSAEVDVRLTCPALEPGTEVTREVTLVASDGARTARTPVTLRQSASVSPMTTLAVRLDPSIVRLANRRRGDAAVIVDNRQGRAPIRVWLHGDDPENVLAFAFAPAHLDVPAGQAVTSRLTFRGPRAPGGREITRSFTVAATDGRSTVGDAGTIIQSAGDRRPWLRVLLTVAGGLLMIMGALGLTIDVAGDGLGDLPLGLALVVFAGLMVFGLTGRSGRLSRFTAVLGALVAVALIVVPSMIDGVDVNGGGGVLAILAGCVLGYIGGLLTRR